MSTVTQITDAPKTKAERLDIFCQALADGKTQEAAYVEAGYSAHNCRANANKFYRSNSAYITAYMSEKIGENVPMALSVIKELVTSKATPAGVRLKAAQDLLDRAGLGAKQKIELTTKNAAEMTTEELQNEVARAIAESPFLAQIVSGTQLPRE